MKPTQHIAVLAVVVLTVVPCLFASDASPQFDSAQSKMFEARRQALQALSAAAAAINTQTAQIETAKRYSGRHEIEATCPSTPITIPTTINGTLTTSSCLDIIGLREDVYAFTATAGQLLTIEMSSNAFDVFPYMTGSTRTTISFRSGSTPSVTRLTYSVPTTGTYRVEAEALWGPPSSQPNTGPYTLTIKVGTGTPPPADFPNHSCGIYPIQCGSSQSARLTFGSCTLDDGTFADYYSFSGTVGDTVTVKLSVFSSTFDQPFVALLPPSSDPTSPPYATGTTEATISSFRLTSTGTWAIGVSSLDKLALGNYTVTLTCNTAPPCTSPSVGISPLSTSVSKGGSALLTASANGTAPIHFAWHSTANPSQVIGSDNNQYQTPALQETTTYYVVVSNACGSVTSANATVTVLAAPCTPPTIVTHPKSATVKPGGTVLLSVSADGTAPLHFAWHATDSPTLTLGPDSNQFQTPPLQQTTTYFVTVSNSCGVTGSATAIVTVGSPKRRSVHH